MEWDEAKSSAVKRCSTRQSRFSGSTDLLKRVFKDLEQATIVNKSALYAEFENKDDLFIASLQRYLEVLRERGTLTKQPLGWSNVEALLKLCYGSWGQKGCFSINSMRKLSDLPPQAHCVGLRLNEKLLEIRETEIERNSPETQPFGIHRGCRVRVLRWSASESPHQKLVSHRLESPGWSPK
jgi:hypothetical protein